MKKNSMISRTLSLALALLLSLPLGVLAEAQGSMAAGEKAQERSQVVTGHPIEEAEYSLIFEGDVDSQLLDRLLPVLSAHQVKAGFFVPAITLAEEPALSQQIFNSGHWLGNYMLHGERLSKDAPMDKQGRSIKRAQEILTAASGQSPSFLKGKATEYVDTLLELIKSQGVPYVLEPNVFLNHTSFTAASQAEAFAKRMSNGAILSIKVRLPIEAAEMPEREAKPSDVLSPSATPGPKVGAAPMPTYQPDERLVEVVEWVLSALADRGMTAVVPEKLMEHQQSEYSDILRRVEAVRWEAAASGINQDSHKAELVGSSYTINHEISLVLEGEASRQTLDSILELLAQRGIQATFFIPALAAARQAETVKKIIGQGHQLGNYLMSGEKHPEKMEQAQQVKNLMSAQMVLESLGFLPDYFKANLGRPDDRLLQSLGAVGIPYAAQPAIYLNHSSFTSREQAEGFVARLQPGSLVSIKMNQVLDESEVQPAMEGRIEPSPTPAVSQRPVSDVSDPGRASDTGETVEQRLIKVMDWLSAALVSQQVAVVSLDELRSHQQEPQAKTLAGILTENESGAIAAGIGADSPKAEIIRSGVDFSGTREVSVVFEGRISKQGLKRLEEALMTHQVPSVFFIPGMEMMQLQEELKALKAQGHQIGNYLMKGEKNAAELPLHTQAESLYRAQQIAKMLLGEAPALLRANDTTPGDQLLSAAAATGIQSLVVPLAFLNHTSFNTQEQAQKYAAKTLSGAIISFKMNDIISRAEAGIPEATATPSILSASAVPSHTPAPEETEERLIQSVIWLLDALKQNGFSFVRPQDIAEGQVLPYPEGTRNGMGMAIRRIASAQPFMAYASQDSQPFRTVSAEDATDMNNIPGEEQAIVISSGPVLGKEVSLVIEALQDVRTVQEIASVLDYYQIKATFYLPALLLGENRELAKSLKEAGHHLGNYLISGEKAVHQLQKEFLEESLGRAQTLIEDVSGEKPATFKGNLSEYTPQLLQLVKKAGIEFAVKPGAVLNNTSFKTREQAERYAMRTAPGSLVSIKVDQVIDISEMPPAPASTALAAMQTPAPTPDAVRIPLLTGTPTPTPLPQEVHGLPDMVKWLVEGYLKAGFAFVSPQQLFKEQQGDYGQLMQIIAQEELDKEVLTKYRTTFTHAPVYSHQPVLEKEISLVFEGTASQETMTAIIALLEEYQVKAMFFIPAKHAALQPEIMVKILKAGHRIGNYSLDGEKQMENLPEEQLLRSLYHAQVILTNLVKQPPELFKGSITAYTDQVQRAVQALALHGSLAPNLYLNHSSFRNEAQVRAYVDKTQWGSILSLKMNQVLDISEVPTPSPKPDITPPPPEADAAPTPIVVPTVIPQLEQLATGLNNEEKLLKITEWLLKGYTASGFDFVSPEKIAADKNPALSALLESELSPSGKETTLVAQSPTTDKEVALMLRFPGDQDRVETFAKALLGTDTKVILAVTGNDIAAHHTVISQLAQKGHYIVSAGFTGRSVTLHSYRDAYLEIRTNALLMQEKLGFVTPFYAPLAGRVGSSTLQAARDLNVIPLSYQIRATPTENDSVQDVMEGPFKWGVRRGDIVYLDLSRAQDITGLLKGVRDLVVDTGYALVTAERLLDNTYAMKKLESIPGFDNLKVNMAFDPRASLTGRMLSQIPTKEKVVFLAIDDWGSDKTITTMLDILKEHNVVGNFFVINSRAVKNPNLLRAMGEDGHVIGSHGFDHELITKTSLDELQRLLVQGYQELTVALGRAPDLVFQPPQLEMDRESTNAVLATGFRAVIGSRVSTHDYKKTAEQVEKFVQQNLQRGAVILIHSSDVASANEALPGIIAYVRSKGYEFGRIPDYLPSVKEAK